MACCGKSMTREQALKLEENRRRFMDAMRVPKCGYCNGILQRLPNGVTICTRCLKRKTVK